MTYLMNFRQLQIVRDKMWSKLSQVKAGVKQGKEAKGR